MRTTHVCFVGPRTEHSDEIVHLFRDVLGMSVAFENPEWSGFSLAVGRRDFVEVFSGDERDVRLFPLDAGSASGPTLAAAIYRRSIRSI